MHAGELNFVTFSIVTFLLRMSQRRSVTLCFFGALIVRVVVQTVIQCPNAITWMSTSLLFTLCFTSQYHNT
jgi:hypothetical protein